MRVFRELGFTDPRDPAFIRILNSPFILGWVLINSAKDRNEELKLEAQKIEALQSFIQPELYMRIKGQTELGSVPLKNWVKNELSKRLGKLMKKRERNV